MINIQKFLKEPLLHFLILGGFLFAYFIWLNPPEVQNDERIVVDANIIEHISKRFLKRYRREATKEELSSRIDDYIVTEIYYREALKLGFDKNDNTIRNHLSSKFKLISKDAVSLLDINDDKLKKYLDHNSKKFIQDARYSFEQIYIDPAKHNNNLKNYINTVKTKLKQNITTQSDSTVFPRYFNQISKTILDGDFGENFSKLLDSAEKDIWLYPVHSNYGLHFVKLSKRTLRRKSELKEVRDFVMREYIYEKQQEFLEQQLKELRKKYPVVSDGNI